MLPDAGSDNSMPESLLLSPIRLLLLSITDQSDFTSNVSGRPVRTGLVNGSTRGFAVPGLPLDFCPEAVVGGPPVERPFDQDFYLERRRCASLWDYLRDDEH